MVGEVQAPPSAARSGRSIGIRWLTARQLPVRWRSAAATDTTHGAVRNSAHSMGGRPAAAANASAQPAESAERRAVARGLRAEVTRLSVACC